MALGKLKWVENLDPRLGTDDDYWFLKVEADYSRDAEEYWLVTAEERQAFTERAQRNQEDQVFRSRRGVFTVIHNTERKVARERESYTAVRIKTDTGTTETWMLTDHDLERIRQRVEARKTTIETNADSWFADLFD